MYVLLLPLLYYRMSISSTHGLLHSSTSDITEYVIKDTSVANKLDISNSWQAAWQIQM